MGCGNSTEIKFNYRSIFCFGKIYYLSCGSLKNSQNDISSIDINFLSGICRYLQNLVWEKISEQQGHSDLDSRPRL